MAFSYNDALGTNLDLVRFNIQDTVQATAVFSDAEINGTLSQVGNEVNRASARLLLILAGNKSRLAIRRTAGDYSEDLTQMAKDLREQAKAFLEMAGMEPAEATAELQTTDFAYREFMENQWLEGQT